MKILLILPLLLLSGCADFNPMSEAEAQAYAACIEKGWKPYFKATTSARVMSCTRK